MDTRFVQKGFKKELSHLIEECGEVLAAAGKLQRWGPRSFNPLLPREQQETNIAWLWREIDDLEKVIGRIARTIRNDFPELPCQPHATNSPTCGAMADPIEQELAEENRRLREALEPFAAIKPSSLYPEDGSENEGYFVLLHRGELNRPDFSGADLARARQALQGGKGR